MGRWNEMGGWPLAATDCFGQRSFNFNFCCRPIAFFQSPSSPSWVSATYQQKLGFTISFHLFHVLVFEFLPAGQPANAGRRPITRHGNILITLVVQCTMCYANRIVASADSKRIGPLKQAEFREQQEAETWWAKPPRPGENGPFILAHIVAKEGILDNSFRADKSDPTQLAIAECNGVAESRYPSAT